MVDPDRMGVDVDAVVVLAVLVVEGLVASDLVEALVNASVRGRSDEGEAEVISRLVATSLVSDSVEVLDRTVVVEVVVVDEATVVGLGELCDASLRSASGSSFSDTSRFRRQLLPNIADQLPILRIVQEQLVDRKEIVAIVVALQLAIIAGVGVERLSNQPMADAPGQMDAYMGLCIEIVPSAPACFLSRSATDVLQLHQITYLVLFVDQS
uniref:Uncharacterized protein n=1 Tax=Anopheles atroparvus TaxID=41427 RepID=A0A182IQL2_ANOAO